MAAKRKTPVVLSAIAITAAKSVVGIPLHDAPSITHYLLVRNTLSTDSLKVLQELILDTAAA